MSEELKPCPFCNSAALVRERHTDDGKPFFVECQGWEFDCGITVAYAATAEQSASLWNRRASGDGGKSEAERNGEPMTLATFEKLHTFLDAAAGSGYQFAGIDADELYVEIFPRRYTASIAAKKEKGE